MIFKNFLYNFICLFFILIFFLIGINIYSNDFGLFFNSKQGEHRIWTNEKTSKYLMSHKYIPNNFDGILIGPSLSDQNINTKLIKSFDIYNASMDGANITEISAVVKKTIENNKKIKFIILCLDPYITKNIDMKSSQISEGDYSSSFLSLFMLKVWIYKLKSKISNNDIYRDSYWGYTIHPSLSKDQIKSNIYNEIKLLNTNKISQCCEVNKKALFELDNLIKYIRKSNIKVVGYFYPKQKLHYDVIKSDYTKYKEKIIPLFDLEKDLVWDFNENNYIVQNDFVNYSDGFHISTQGAIFILNNIEKKLKGFID